MCDEEPRIKGFVVQKKVFADEIIPWPSKCERLFRLCKIKCLRIHYIFLCWERKQHIRSNSFENGQTSLSWICQDFCQETWRPGQIGKALALDLHQTKHQDCNATHVWQHTCAGRFLFEHSLFENRKLENAIYQISAMHTSHFSNLTGEAPILHSQKYLPRPKLRKFALAMLSGKAHDGL